MISQCYQKLFIYFYKKGQKNPKAVDWLWDWISGKT